jgi:hypothetical protein
MVQNKIHFWYKEKSVEKHYNGINTNKKRERYKCTYRGIETMKLAGHCENSNSKQKRRKFQIISKRTGK